METVTSKIQALQTKVDALTANSTLRVAARVVMVLVLVWLAVIVIGVAIMWLTFKLCAKNSKRDAAALNRIGSASRGYKRY